MHNARRTTFGKTTPNDRANAAVFHCLLFAPTPRHIVNCTQDLPNVFEARDERAGATDEGPTSREAMERDFACACRGAAPRVSENDEGEPVCLACGLVLHTCAARGRDAAAAGAVQGERYEYLRFDRIDLVRPVPAPPPLAPPQNKTHARSSHAAPA